MTIRRRVGIAAALLIGGVAAFATWRVGELTAVVAG
jgi:hypothetical protein